MANLENFGPEGQHLYFRNKGLFSDNYLAHRLEKEKVGFVSRHWNSWSTDEFNKAYEAISDLWDEKKEYIETCKESQLEDEFIKHVFNILGWEYVVQPDITRLGKRSIPDYALFSDKNEKSRASKIKDIAFFDRASAVADAKAMKVDLDGIAEDNTNPSYQIISYLDSTGKKWGILTNGRYWRIYSNKAKSRQRAFYEVNLETVLNGSKNQRERFKYFFNFFRRDAFVGESAASQSFLDIVFAEGESYASEVETELKDRAFVVVEKIAQGFCIGTDPETEEDLREVYENSLFFLFRLMFLLNCEAKSILPVSRTTDYYRYSLRKLCNEIKEDKELNKKWSSQTSTYDQIVSLLSMLKKGDADIKIHGFGEEFFQSEKKRFFSEHKIPDSVMNQVLLDLACELDKKERVYRFIDFGRLSVDHLGSIFEGLLEFKLVGKKNGIELVNTSGERKATGSYYTPDYIVDFIIEQALTPILENKNAKDILKLNILDPAMGSGHFLLGVVRFLEAKVLQLMNDGDKSVKLTPSEIRLEILKCCVHGVDKNILAKELSKFSLWMIGVDEFSELEPLDDQLICRDSLSSNKVWMSDFPNIMKAGGFDAVVGNPPYLKEANNKALFEELRKGPMAEYCVGKMDLWYLFTILSIGLLRDGGRHAFIAPNTWVSSEAAGKLRGKIREKANLEKYINFADFKVFKDASIQTMIFVLAKGPQAVSAQYFKLQDVAKEEVFSTLKNLKDKDFIDVDVRDENSEAPFIFVDTSTERVLNKIKKSDVRFLSDNEIGSGIDVLQDFVSKSHLPKFKGAKISAGEGIFVLTSAEMKKVAVSANDKRKIKPYYGTEELGRYMNRSQNQYWIIYADEEVRSSINDFPGIKKHLDKFKAVLTSAYKPYGLHRPREESLFNDGTIFSVRKTRRPAFCHADFPAYVARTFMIIKPEGWQESNDYLVAILNSDLVFAWLYNQGKKQGEQLQVDKDPLLSIPIKRIDFDSANERKIHDDLSKLSKKAAQLSNKGASSELETLEKEINAQIYKLYSLSSSDIKTLESSMPDIQEKNAAKKRAA